MWLTGISAAKIIEMTNHLKSRAELTQHVICPAPTRSRDDDRIVELFLHAFRQGRFSKDPVWLPQHTANVEAIATDQDGRRLAIEHTRVFSFEQQPKKENDLQPIAECLERVQLPGVSDRWYQVRFRTNFMGRKLLRHTRIVQEQLPIWALRELPRLEPRDHFEYALRIPIQLPEGKSVCIDVGVEVWDRMQVNRPIHVSGILPNGDRLESEIRRALGDKLPKLAATDAEERLLILDKPTLSDSDNGLLEIILAIFPDFPLLHEIQGIVFATTALLGEKIAYFSIWDVGAGDWSEYLKATLTE
jgi:hypothetical protein